MELALNVSKEELKDIIKDAVRSNFLNFHWR
jgi:hypothetical protein